MNTLRLKIRPWQFLRVAGFLTCVPALAATAEAARLTVKVQRSGGTPIAEARVCLTRPGNPAGGAVMLTDSQGSISRNVVPGTYRVVVIKDGFVSTDETINVGDSDLERVIVLQAGSDNSGLTCDIQSYQLTVLPPIKILSFKLNGGAESTTDPTVTLNLTFDRPPAFYRVAQLTAAAEVNNPPANLNAPWVAYDPARTITYSFEVNRRYGTRHLAVQVKPSDSGGSVSRVSVDSIVLSPAALKTYTVTGDDLKELFQKAADEWGFGLRGKVIENTPDGCAGDKIEFPVMRLTNPVARHGPGGTTLDTKTVEAELFAGRRLNPFWRIKPITFVDGRDWPADAVRVEIKYRRRPAPAGSEDPYHLVHVKLTAINNIHPPSLATPPPNSGGLCFEGRVYIPKVELEGPDGLDWRDAFRR